ASKKSSISVFREYTALQNACPAPLAMLSPEPDGDDFVGLQMHRDAAVADGQLLFQRPFHHVRPDGLLDLAFRETEPYPATRGGATTLDQPQDDVFRVF